MRRAASCATLPENGTAAHAAEAGLACKAATSAAP